MATLNRTVAQVLGAVLVLVGILGFIPGITTNGPGPFVGHNEPEPARVLGIFEVNVLHSLIHFATGAFLLAGAFMDNGRNARTFNIILGAVYLVVAVAGWLIAPLADLVAFDMADHWLHVALGVVLLGVGLAVREETGGALRRRPAM